MQTEHANSEQIPVTPRCRNCQVPLTGQYCWRCGQRAESRVISLRRLLSELLGDLFELDSRIWRSLMPLLWRPGFLTNEYLAGRQVHYIPPFRLYVILSLTFFFFTAFNESSVVVLSDSDRQEIREDLADELAAVGVEDGAVMDITGLCEAELNVDLLGRRIDQAMLKERCQAIVADPGRFGAAIIDNLPLALFLALPLLALASKILYIGSGRFYVEHLLFYAHFHSFCFLLGLLMLAVDALDALLLPGDFISETITGFSILYVMGYLLLALHAVYRTSRLGTLVRYILLLQAYLACLGLGFLATLLWTIATL